MNNLFAFKLTIFFIIIFLNLSGYSQEKSTIVNYTNKIGIGGFKFDSKTYLITASFSRIFKQHNELIFLIYYIKEGRKDISTSLAFNWATIKRNSRFNFYFGPEINLDYSWYPKYNSNLYVSRYGYFLCLDLIPSLRIYKRISISLELKVGHGYLWASNDEYTYRNVVYYSERGWYFRGLPSLRVTYKF